MILVRATSRGPIVIHFTYVTRSIGLAAAIGQVDEDGWVGEFVNWNSGADKDRSLADAIVEAIPVPTPEAEALAAAALEQLHERGGDESDMTRRDWLSAGALLTSTLGVAFILILVALAALTWAVIKLV